MAVALAACVAAAVGCGGGSPVRDPLEWKGAPLLFRAKGDSPDRVVIGSVRNRSGRGLTFRAASLGVRDGRGRPLRAYAQFTRSYAHGLYGAYQRPNPLPAEELQRLGIVRTIGAGKTSPLYVAFRLRTTSRRPFRIFYENGSLPVPSRTRRES